MQLAKHRAAHREEFAAATNHAFYRIYSLPRQRELFRVMGVEAVPGLPLISRTLIGGPLEAQTVAVGIGDVQLLHAVRRDGRLFYTEAMGAEMPVSAVQIFATEEETSVVMRGYTSRIGGGWALVLFVGGVEHYFHAIQLEERPTEVVAGARCGDKFEAENVAVEMDGGRHVENLEQGSEASNINWHGILLFGRPYSRFLQA
jgi:hypothetical protein